MANLNQFSRSVGKKKVDSRLHEGYINDIMKVISGRGKDIDMKRLNKIGQEIKTLKLPDEKMCQAALMIAKALKNNDVDQLLATCEREIPNLEKNKNDIVYYLSGYLKKATDAQKSKWKEIESANAKD